MSVTKKIVYRCDVCGREFDEEGHTKRVSLPTRVSNKYDSDLMYDHTMARDATNEVLTVELHNFDLCPSCLEEYENLVFTNFANIVSSSTGKVIRVSNHEKVGDFDKQS